jgi:hypothetical protein
MNDVAGRAVERNIEQLADQQTQPRATAQFDAITNQLLLLVVRDFRCGIFEVMLRDASAFEEAIHACAELRKSFDKSERM